MDHQVQNLLGVSMDKIKEMVDNNTVVGDPITTPDGTVLIPVSKVPTASRPADRIFPPKISGGLFGGGSGAGINVTGRWPFSWCPAGRYGCCTLFPSRIPPTRW